MNESIRNVVEREIEVRSNTGELVETQKIKVTQHLYPCRPQVAERNKNWVKFGEAKGVPRGENKRNEVSINGPVPFLNDEGQVDEEIDVAKDLINLSKQHVMSKNMRK